MPKYQSKIMTGKITPNKTPWRMAVSGFGAGVIITDEKF